MNNFIRALLLWLFLAAPAFAEEDRSIDLNSILGPVTSDYVTEKDYNKTSGDFHQIRLLLDYEPGLTDGIWQRNDAKDIIKALAEFYGVNGSPALRELWQTTLSDGFKGASLSPGKKKNDIALTVARMQTMLELGLFHDAIRLYHAIKDTPAPDVIAQEAINAMAYAGMADAACLEVSFVTQSIRTIPWLKQRFLCALHNDEKEIAIALQGYLKEIINKDTIHQTVQSFLKKPNFNGSIKTNLSPLQQALLLAHGGKYKEDIFDKAKPTLIASIALSPYLPIVKRLKAADKAIELGVISPKDLLLIYEQLDLSDEQITDARNRVLNGKPLGNASLLKVVTKTHDPAIRAQLIEKALQKYHYKPNIFSQLFLRYIDKISSQASDIQSFATTGYSLAIWQDYLSACKAFFPFVQDSHAALTSISDIKLPEEKDIDALLSYIDQTHKKSATIRKARILAALKAAEMVRDDKINHDMLKKWRENKKNTRKRGIFFLESLNTFSIEKPGLTAPTTIYQLLENYYKNQFFAENRKITLEIIIQSVL